MSGLLSSYNGHLRSLNYALQANTNTSGGEAEDRSSLSSCNSDILISIHFQRVRHCHLLKHWIPCASWGVNSMWFPLSRWGGDLRLSLGSPQGIQTSLHLVRWKTSLNLSHCREILPSFESGPLAVHPTLNRKHRVPLTYLLLRENSTWGSCGMLAHHFSQRQGISSHLETIWCAWSFPWVAVLKLIFIWIWNGCLRESL